MYSICKLFLTSLYDNYIYNEQKQVSSSNTVGGFWVIMNTHSDLPRKILMFKMSVHI